MPHEIVTLSFGSYASFVSAHYWNLQDEAAGYSSREEWSDYGATLDHDVLYMATGEARDGSVSYRPRAVLFDTTASLGGVSLAAACGGFGGGASGSTAAATSGAWSGRVEVHRSDPVARSAFVELLEEQEHLSYDEMGPEEAARLQAELEAAARQLDPSGPDSGARYWTDFCKALLHPRSLCCLPGQVLLPGAGAGAGAGAGGWGDAGEALGPGVGATELREDMEDRVRAMGEACDSLAGFQVWAEDTSCWGSLAALLLTDVVEEYAGRPLVLFSLRPHGSGQATGGSNALRARAELSEGLATARMAELASLYVPLAAPADPATLPYLSYNPAVPYHTSAILATAIDTALLPVRLTGARSPLGEPHGATDLHSLVRLLRGRGGAALAAAHVALPCPSLPTDLQQLAAQLDERMQPPPHARAVSSQGPGAQAAGPAGPAGPLTRGSLVHGTTAGLDLSRLAALTPGLAVGLGPGPGGGEGLSLAETYTLRGGRTDAGPASTSSALSALDTLLLRNPHRAVVRHRCTAPMPLAVPLPYPGFFPRCVTVHGDVLITPAAAAAGASAGAAGAAGALRPRDVGVQSAPVLSVLQTTAEFRGWLLHTEDTWRRAAGGMAGRAALDAWGLDGAEAEEVATALHDMAASYEWDE